MFVNATRVCASEMAMVFFLPSCKLSASLKTAACVCMVFCIVSLNSAVEIEPLAFLTQSKLATVSSPAF